MRKNPLQLIERNLPHANNVLLITDGKEKPKKRDINLLGKNVSSLTTVSSVNRSTRRKIIKSDFNLILGHKNGFFIPHPEYILN